MTIWELDTPALLIDLDRMEANLQRAATYAEGHGLDLRPHTKTHKSPYLGLRQVEHGAAGLTVAKVSEAEVMAADGLGNLLVAYPVWGESKWSRLTEVAKTTPLTVALDSEKPASGLSRHAVRAGLTIGILAEVDLGMRRCGFPPGQRFRNFTRAVDRMPGLQLEGLMFYPGHVNLAAPDGERQLELVAGGLNEALDGFRQDGLSTSVVSGGSTPTLFHSHRVPGMTEIRPGTYIFNDRSQVAMGACGWSDCAATIMTTVVSTPSPGSAVIDGGSKTFTSDPVRPQESGFGCIVGMPGARFEKMSEEHGVLDLGGHQGRPPQIGERLRIVPNHVCVTVNMHSTAHGIRGEEVEQSWPVKGRGKLQ